MKTVFISSFHQLISRNILATPLIGRLLEGSEIRIVLLVPDDKKAFFENEFGNKRVLVEGVSRTLDKRDIFLRYLALSSVDCCGIEVIRKWEYDQWRSRLIRAVGGRRAGQRFLRGVDALLTPRGRFAHLLDHYRPAVIFSTDVQNENDIRLMREARSRGIKTVGMVRSWDNFTTKGALRVVPDILMVTSEIVAEEAMKYSFVPKHKIRVVGVPHYDRYLNLKTQHQASSIQHSSRREAFCRSMKLDPAKKIVVFAPIGDRYIRDNLLDKMVLEALSAMDVNVLVRMPPSDYVNLSDWKSGGAFVSFDYSGRGAPGGDKDRKLNEVGREDDDRLAAELIYCDVVVTGQSTIAIDAMIFDKPVVIIHFDQEDRPYFDSVKRYYDSEYYVPVVVSGGVRLARNKNELVLFVEEYLANPRLDSEKRRFLAERQTYKLDGGSTERMFRILESIIQVS